MAIDLPWIVTAFGPIKNVYAVKSKNTELNISYNDNYLITLEHESGAKGVFAVDVVARKPYRHIDVYGEQLHLSWNGTADSLIEFNIEEKRRRKSHSQMLLNMLRDMPHSLPRILIGKS